jgi:hypothetical protein
MGLAHSPRIVTDGLRASIDVNNIKCYPGSGTTLTSLNARENATATTITTADDGSYGKVLDLNNSTQTDIIFSPLVNHETWSLIFWIRSTGLTTSNFRAVIRLEVSGGPNYFYLVDTRETTNSYILGYQRDYVLNQWLTTAFNTAAQWDDQTWWCLGVSHNNTVFKSYRQGSLFATQTQTLNVTDYTDITQLRINSSGSNTVYMGPVYFYDRVLTDGEFNQNFNAMRGRFGL